MFNSFLKLSLTPFVLLMFFLLPPSGHAQLLSKSGKNWKVNFNMSGIYANNLAQNPRGAGSLFTQDSDSAFSWSGSGQYVHTFNDKWSLRGDYHVDMTVHSELGQYDMTNNSWGLKPRYRIDKTSFVDFQYYYIWSIAGGGSYSGVNYQGLSYIHSLGPLGIFNLRLFYAHSENFRTQGRSSNEVGAGFTHMYIFPGTRNYVGGGYDLSDEATAGGFGRTVHKFKLKGRYVLPYEVHFRGQYALSVREYGSFASTAGGLRNDTQHTFNFSLSRLLLRNWKALNGLNASLSWNRTTNESNVVFREYTSNTLTATLSASF